MARAPHEVLGIDKTASIFEVKQAFGEVTYEVLSSNNLDMVDRLMEAMAAYEYYMEARKAVDIVVGDNLPSEVIDKPLPQIRVANFARPARSESSEKQAEELYNKVRDQVAARPLKGIVARTTERGFGFLTSESSGKDIFFHAQSLSDFEFNDLNEGQPVEFEMIEGPKGPAAANVRAIIEDNPEPEEIRDIDVATDEIVKSGVVQAVDALTRQLIAFIAERPTELKFVEWRTLERIIAEVFEGLGFSVVLTESGNDGGKDVIVSTHLEGVKKTYLIEVKHWTRGNKVGGKIVQSFLHVIARERSQGGLLLASGGFGKHAFESISEIDHQVISAGDSTKIVDLCQMYRKSREGIWSPTGGLHNIIFENSLTKKVQSEGPRR